MVVVVWFVRLLICALTTRSFSLQELSEVEQQLEASSDAFFRKHKLTVNCQLSAKLTLSLEIKHVLLIIRAGLQESEADCGGLAWVSVLGLHWLARLASILPPRICRTDAAGLVVLFGVLVLLLGVYWCSVPLLTLLLLTSSHSSHSSSH